MTIWFTSDHHFHHTKILEYCKRPFPNLEAMHTALQDRWNAVVLPQDEVWVLGDFAFGPHPSIARLLDSLEGRKHLVQGNHDRHRPAVYLRCGFASVQQHAELELEGLRIRMRHRPPDHSEAAQLTLCGHVHEKWAWDPVRLTLNVGVDVWDFRPISAEQVAETLVKAQNKGWAAKHLRLPQPREEIDDQM